MHRSEVEIVIQMFDKIIDSMHVVKKIFIKIVKNEELDPHIYILSLNFYSHIGDYKISCSSLFPYDV